MNRKSVWVVITGIVRDEAFLHQRLQFLASLKSEGLVEQVVCSTWDGEYDRLPEVLAVVRQHGFLLVEGAEPDLSCAGHYWHQMVSLTNALEACPEDCFVLRTRTDKCGPEDGFIEEEVRRVLTQGWYARETTDPFRFFEYRIGIIESGTARELPILFFWNDRYYVGHRRDLLRLVNRDVVALGTLGLVPEQVLFSHPFRARIRLFDEFFRTVNQFAIVGKLMFGQRYASELGTLRTLLQECQLFRLALLSERHVLRHGFFGLSSGAPIDPPLDFHGTPLGTAEERACVVSPDWHARCDLASLRATAEPLTAFLSERLGIPPLSRRIPQSDPWRVRIATEPTRLAPVVRGAKALSYRADDPRIRSNVGVLRNGVLDSSGQAGCLMFGPYETFAAGTYDIDVFGAQEPGPPTAAFCDAAWAGGSQMGAPIEDVGGERPLARWRLVLDRTVSGFEVRAWVTEQSSVAISRFDITPVDTRSDAR